MLQKAYVARLTSFPARLHVLALYAMQMHSQTTTPRSVVVFDRLHFQAASCQKQNYQSAKPRTGGASYLSIP